MVDVASLARRARKSGDGEAYQAIERGDGSRLGVGARASRGSEPQFFVEVILDPFPERPLVDPAQMASRAALLERLKGRGYALSCDDAGVVTCERVVRGAASRAEATEVSKLLRSRRTKAEGPPRR